MPWYCSAYGCFNKGKIEGITYHRFPKNPELRAKWINKVKRKDWEPTTYSKLCSSHFRESDIDRTSLSCVRIREGAVPEIFPAISHPKDRPIRKRHIQTESDQQQTSQCVVESPTRKKFELNKTKSTLDNCKKKIKNFQTCKRRLNKSTGKLNAVVDVLKKKLNFKEEECVLLTSISKTSTCLINPLDATGR